MKHDKTDWSEVMVDMNMKRMVGEFIDCVGMMTHTLMMLMGGDDDEVQTATDAITRSHDATKDIIVAAFDDEEGTGVFELAYIACSLAANVSSILFEAEAAVSMEEK